MPVGEFVFSFIGEIIAQVVFEGTLGGIGRLLRGIYYWIRKFITGKEREIPEVKRLEKYYLYKIVKITYDFNELIPKGTRGTVMEVIDEQNIFVEFQDMNGKPITIKEKQIFVIKRNTVRLERKKRTHNIR